MKTKSKKILWNALCIFITAFFLLSCENASAPKAGNSQSSGKKAEEIEIKKYPADKAILYTTVAEAKAHEIGKEYSIQLGSQPYLDDYMTITPAQSGGASVSSYRIPSITKTKINTKTRLIAAFDVRYRGTFTGNGDVGQSGVHGSDITVMYSDNGGATWTTAKNKQTGKKPAIDVKNSYDADGKTASIELDTDVCDPQLIALPDGTIYLGAAGGAGILGSNWGKSNFRIFKSTDNGETWEEDTDPNNSYAKLWRPTDYTEGNEKFNITTPGHGIVLTKDVPGSETLKTGVGVMPIQGLKGNDYGIYLKHGEGVPSTWQGTTPNAKFNTSQNLEEGQICQLDDGSILVVAKNGGAKLAVFKNNVWTSINTNADAFSGGGAGQIGVIKVKDGISGSSCGIVAVSRTLDGASNASTAEQGAGRGHITVGFARDKSGINGYTYGGTTSPLDNGTRYWITVREEQQSYFGYTDMVMIDDTTLGVLYESFQPNNPKAHGMRFVAIDVSKIIENLSALPN